MRPGPGSARCLVRGVGDDWLDHNLHAPVEAAPFLRGVGGARRGLAPAEELEPLHQHALVAQVIVDRLGAMLGEGLVVLVGADVVRVPDDGEVRLAVTNQHVRDLVHGGIEARLDRRGIEIKRRLRRHRDQQIVLVHLLDIDRSRLDLGHEHLLEILFLRIHVGTHGRAGEAAADRADQRAPVAVAFIADRTHGGPGSRADDRALLGVGHGTPVAVLIGRAAGGSSREDGDEGENR